MTVAFGWSGVDDAVMTNYRSLLDRIASSARKGERNRRFPAGA
jgi:hypothetical protein